MKRLGVYFVLAVCVSLVAPVETQAQNPPPGCCYETSPVRTGEDGSTSAGGITVSRALLRTLNVDRATMLGRISDLVFPGRNTDLVISLTRAVSPRVAASRTDAGDGTVIAVEERRFVQIARDRARAEDLESSNEFYLTDGSIFVKVFFDGAAPAER